MTIPGKRTVLVVDDEPAIRNALERLLESSGYETVVASDGEEALVRASEQEFEVALMDIRMPGLSGIETLEQFRTFYPDVSVIMLTAVGDLEVAVGAMKSGAYDYVTKPFNLDDILIRVEKAREKRYLALQVKNHQRDIEERLSQRERELRAMTTQTVHALIQEETLARELKAKGGKRKGLPAGTNIKEFGAKLLRRLNGSSS